MRAALVLLMTSILPLTFGGCANEPGNPSFNVSIEQAERALGVMEREKRPFDRPVVVVAGYLDPGVGVAVAAAALRRLTTEPAQVIEVPLLTTTTFEACRARVIEKVEERFPSGDDRATVEVDVVGISMGGLVSRYAAIDLGNRVKTLRVKRLFTVATPHRGANLAQWPSMDPRHLGMRAGSEFLSRLDAALPSAEYELVPYVRLGDAMVGAANAAPAGETAWWVTNRALQPAHLGAHTDPRILADIARRLRGEAPFTREPRAPLPE